MRGVRPRRVEEDVWDKLAAVHYVATDSPTNEGEDYVASASRAQRGRGHGGNRLFYLAVPPDAFETS